MLPTCSGGGGFGAIGNGETLIFAKAVVRLCQNPALSCPGVKDKLIEFRLNGHDSSSNS